MTDPVAIDSAEFRRTLGHFPTGVTVVTAPGADGPVGMAIGSFTSVSLDPPLVGFLPTQSSSTWAAIKESGSFCVNILAADQLELCGVMASRSETKFDGVEWAPAASGSPVLAGVVAYIDCTIDAVHPAGDHDVVIGRVDRLEVLNEEALPMVFFKGQYGTFG
jgi:3-hydroxy-9,10-secoandrosta-1,3,5(10)-triene-9,17-dione monooxygenase reductase component